MAMKKTGLGKGLDALFSESMLQPEENILKDGEEIVKSIKIIDIEPNRDQPRRTFDEESIGELAESIKKYGLIAGGVFLLFYAKDNGYLKRKGGKNE